MNEKGRLAEVSVSLGVFNNRKKFVHDRLADEEVASITQYNQ